MDLAGRQLLNDADVLGFLDALEEVVRVDVAVGQHLHETGVDAAGEAAALCAAADDDVHRLEGEVGEVLALGLGQTRDHRREIGVAERNVPAFVTHHIERELLEELALGSAVHVVEGAQRQALDDHVHADHDLLVAVRLQRCVD